MCIPICHFAAKQIAAIYLGIKLHFLILYIKKPLRTCLTFIKSLPNVKVLNIFNIYKITIKGVILKFVVIIPFRKPTNTPVNKTINKKAQLAKPIFISFARIAADK